MKEPYVLGRGAGPRWTVHPPVDPYGDGYVHTAVMELREDGLTASTVAELDGVPMAGPQVTTLPAFLDGLAAGWTGWPGARTWRSLGGQLALDARHDGRGHVTLGVTLRRPGHDIDGTAWSARCVFVLEAGEETSRFARDLGALLEA
ncbi:hypothetical protein CO540_19245 [Micromonospora sp. WMMA2032]|uniref:DUF6228 family protein n=1 Tax=unclassified Micromonospora TaxID=2617518 RepID=UPI000C059C80|nr:DUF6228 family protein [Micromonospora sp. WMMA2032]ATO15705.1 hypothetical protein CO540_19245 [Micromonospora sp. WMMA2032]